MTGDINSWVQFVVENKAKELDICLAYGPEAGQYVAPLCVNSGETIRNLSLVGCDLQIHAFPTTWNQLKSLRIEASYCSASMINELLLGSPRLEVFELDVLENNGSLNIQSTSFINTYAYFDDVVDVALLRINCTNLEWLVLSGGLFSEYCLEDVSSVRDLTFSFDLIDERGDSDDVSKLRCPLAPFTNVKFLKFEYVQIDVYIMMVYLANFPNVRTLVVELVNEIASYFEHKQRLEVENEFENNSPLSYLSQLRTIEISSHEATCPDDIIRFIQLLLKHCWVLEKLVAIGHDILHMFEPEWIMSFPRASPMAQVILLQTDCHQRRVPWSG